MKRAQSKTAAKTQQAPFLVMGWGLLFLAAAAMLAGCTKREDRVLFEGEYFRTKVSKADRDNPQDFVVQVPDISKNFEAAREAGRFEATRYCVQTFGTSDIVWTAGPDVDPDSLLIEKDRLTLTGSCLF